MPRLGDPIGRCPAEETEKCLSVRASLFFDGTLNNRENVAIGEQQRAGGEETAGSYANDFSNVARLESNWSDKTSGADIVLAVYAEGAGSDTGESDSLEGKALGTGGYGVSAKVAAGFDKLLNDLEEALKEERTSIQSLNIIVDVFGFSRGAASARYAIHRVIQDRLLHQRLGAQGYKINSAQILFAGLYDTVAAHGMDHSDDTEDLNLDAIRHAEQVLHLCAAEEYRENFRLTNINSNPGGREVFLPGVHSDVGGGYRDGEGEVVTLSEGTKSQVREDERWLIASGWYRKEELSIHSRPTPSQIIYRLTGRRRSIRQQYSYIPLQIMARYAENSGVVFVSELKQDFAIPADLQNLKDELDAYVDAGRSSAADWIERKDKTMQDIRHRYFHFSANYARTGMDPEWADGRRTRVEQHG